MTLKRTRLVFFGLHSRLRRSCNPITQSRAFHCHFTHTSGFSLYSYTPHQRSWKGVYWFHLVRLSVYPSVDRIVSALYLQQYSSDPFHICTSYQATSEGVSWVMFVSKLKKYGEFFKFVSLTLIFLTWDPIWLNRIGNHEVAGGIHRTLAF